MSLGVPQWQRKEKKESVEINKNKKVALAEQSVSLGGRQEKTFQFSLPRLEAKSSQ